MLLMNARLLKLQSRPRIRRLKLSGTVQGLVEEPAAFDGRTIRARWSLARRSGRCVGESCPGLGARAAVASSGEQHQRDAERIH